MLEFTNSRPFFSTLAAFPDHGDDTNTKDDDEEGKDSESP